MTIKHKLNLALFGGCLVIAFVLFVFVKTAYVTGKAQGVQDTQVATEEQLHVRELGDSIDSVAVNNQ